MRSRRRSANVLVRTDLGHHAEDGGALVDFGGILAVGGARRAAADVGHVELQPDEGDAEEK